VALFVGFFSADGRAIQVEGSPVIAVGLERFKHFRDLLLVVGHEYAHCAQHALGKDFFLQEDRPLSSAILAEGLAAHFTQRIAPEIPLHRHLFLTRERLRWCKANRRPLLDWAEAELDSSRLIPVLFGPGDPTEGLPPRVGYFIAHEMVGPLEKELETDRPGSGLREWAAGWGKITECKRSLSGNGGTERGWA
jgi:uncharacterized protein YjaZ